MVNSTSSEVDVEIVYSNLVGSPIFSEEEFDFRFPEQEFRMTEDNQARDLEDGNKRLLE
jgi:hypothetical protein